MQINKGWRQARPGRFGRIGFGTAAAPDTVAPTISAFSIAADGTLSVYSNEAGTLHLIAEASPGGTYADCDALIAASGSAALYTTISVAANTTTTATVDISSLSPSTTYTFSVGEKDAAGNASSVLQQDVTTASADISVLNTTVAINDSTPGSSFVGSSVAPQAGTDRIAIAMLATHTTTSGSDHTVDWNGKAMTLIGAVVNTITSARVAMYYLKEADFPASAGPITVSVTGGGTSDCAALTLTQMDNVNQATPAGTPVIATGYGTYKPVTVNVTNATSAMLSCFSIKATGTTYLPITETTNSLPLNSSGETGLYIAHDCAFSTVFDLPGVVGNRTHTHQTSNPTASNDAIIGVEIFHA